MVQRKISIICGLIALIDTALIEITEENYSNLQSCLRLIPKEEGHWTIFHSNKVRGIVKAIHESQVPLYNLNFHPKNAAFTQAFYKGNRTRINIFVTCEGDFRHLQEQFKISKNSFTYKGVRITILKIQSQTALLTFDAFRLIIPPTDHREIALIPAGSATMKRCHGTFPDLLRIRYRSKTPFRMSIFSSTTLQNIDNKFLGRDMDLLKPLLDHLNMSYEFITPTDGITYGNEANGSGAFGAVLRGEADLAANSRIILARYYHLVEYTYPGVRDDVMILIPVTHQLQEIFYLTKMGLLFVLPAMLCVLIFFKLSSSASLMEAFLIFIRICIATTPGRSYSSKGFRVFYMSFALLAFFGSSLFALQILKLERFGLPVVEIKSIEQFAATSMNIFVRPGLWEIVNNSLGNSDFRESIMSRLDEVSFGPSELSDEWNHIMNCSECAIVCRKSTFMRYIQHIKRKAKEKCFSLVTEPLMPSLNSYIMSYGSPYYEEFNKLLCRLDETGHAVKNKGPDDPKRESMLRDVSTLKMPFLDNDLWIRYMIAMALATLVFILEVIVHYCKTRHLKNTNK